MESARLRLHACMWEVRACTRGVKLDKARKKLKRHSFKGSSFQSVTENVQQQGHFFKLFKSFHMQHLKIKAIQIHTCNIKSLLSEVSAINEWFS